MHLADESGQIDLVPIRWEFAERENSEWNWLVVRCEIQAPDGTWEFEDPLMTPREGVMLADWLEQLESLHVGSSFTFTEPEVRFTRADVAADGRLGLEVCFDYEAAPPWVDSEAEEDGYCLRLHVAADEAVRAAMAIRAEIRGVTNGS